MFVSVFFSFVANMNFQYLSSKKGKHKVIAHLGYTYCRDRGAYNVTYYKCTDHKSCPGRGKLVGNQFLQTQEHEHYAILGIIERRATVDQVRQQARENPTSSAGQIYDQVAIRRKSKLGLNANSYTVPPMNEVRHHIREEKKKNYPRLPHSIEEIPASMTADMKSLSGSDFVFFEGSIMMFARQPTLFSQRYFMYIHGSHVHFFSCSFQSALHPTRVNGKLEGKGHGLLCILFTAKQNQNHLHSNVPNASEVLYHLVSAFPN